MVQTGGAPNKERLDGNFSAGKRLRRIFSNSFSFPFVESIISHMPGYGKFLPNNFLIIFFMFLHFDITSS